MPRKEKQKLKLLTLLSIFMRETDEEHPLSVPRLVELLKEHGIEAERKSVYDDIQTLNEMPQGDSETQQKTGIEIVQQRGRGGGYYMNDTPFELAELKLLVDAVYASRFITARKSRELIEKLGQFTSRYKQEQLNRKVLVSRRHKNEEETILYHVDALHRAIVEGCQVKFQYCDWNLQKKLEPRHDGQYYQVSPWTMVWENSNYYMIAYMEGYLKHFRVDKLRNVQLLPDVPREGEEEYNAFDVDVYTQQLFGMFNGPVEEVTLQCENRLVGVIIDRFGKEPILVPCEDGSHFRVTIQVQVSAQFYGWVAGLGPGVEIVGPAEVRANMKGTLDKLQDVYR